MPWSTTPAAAPSTDMAAHINARSVQKTEDTGVDLFPIRVLSEKTGVGASTLRAWERRYGLLKPERTPKGHRLYHTDDIRRVQRILTLLREGHSLPVIADQLLKGHGQAQALDKLVSEPGVWAVYLQDTLQAIGDFSTERLEAIFNEASSLYPIEMVTERLIEPTLVALGERWKERDAGIAEEHFYAAWVRNRLGARFHHAVGQARGARILCAGLPGSHHEIGLLLFSLSALSRGYRVLYLGVDLPLSQIPLVLERSAARGVILSSRTPIDAQMEKELASLAAGLKVPLMLGGPCSDDELSLFDKAGGVRLGSRIQVALELLASRVALFSGSGENDGRPSTTRSGKKK